MILLSDPIQSVFYDTLKFQLHFYYFISCLKSKTTTSERKVQKVHYICSEQKMFRQTINDYQSLITTKYSYFLQREIGFQSHGCQVFTSKASSKIRNMTLKSLISSAECTQVSKRTFILLYFNE